MTRWSILGLAAGLVAIARADPAAAHAFLDHAEPRVGATVNGSPAALVLTFTEPIEPAFSRVVVRDAAGGPVATGPPTHPAPATIAVPLPALAPGTYTVTWSVVSVDSHATDGHFVFTVRGP